MVISQYLDVIFEDLLKAAGSRKWRERQAAVAGLANLLPGRTFKEIMGEKEGAGEGGRRLESVWVTAFRAVDDLKESVQLAGIDLAKSLTQLTGRLSNREEAPGEEVKEVVGVVLPLLLTQGLVSKAKEVQAVAVMMLVRMVKGAGECLRPWLAELVSALIEAQSAIEPQQLQYMQFHATSSGMTEEGMEVSNQTALSSLSPCSRLLPLPPCLPPLLNSNSAAAFAPRTLSTPFFYSRGVSLNSRRHTHSPSLPPFSPFPPPSFPFFSAATPLRTLPLGSPPRSPRSLPQRTRRSIAHLPPSLPPPPSPFGSWPQHTLLRGQRRRRSCHPLPS